jgi:hypothetical protein
MQIIYNDEYIIQLAKGLPVIGYESLGSGRGPYFNRSGNRRSRRNTDDQRRP